MATIPIFNLFARSPLGPIAEHMEKVCECAGYLAPFFQAVLESDWETAKTEQKKIAHLERDADNIKRDLRLHLPKGLFLPVARTDILELLVVQDQIANLAKDIAGLVMGRKMQFPKTIFAIFLEFLQRSIETTQQGLKAISELDDLLEVGFRGQEVDFVQNMIHKLDQKEHETDKLQRKVLQSLFNLESKLAPVDVMFMYKIIEWISELADRAQQTGGRLQILLAR